MAITHFDCVGNLRLAYRGIGAVHMTPEKKLQMILGTNGSGKSTILSEMSALAANHSHYQRGVGYKRTVHDHRGHEYECLSDFRGDKNHFMMKKDQKVLYEGHSSEAYQAMVYQEFKLTPEIHAVRIGKKRLSNMSTDERRRWLTNMSPEDYTYAIEYFKRLSETYRDCKGAVERINKKLVNERKNLIDEETLTQLLTEIADLKSQKNDMFRFWRPMEDSVDNVMDRVRQVDERLEQLTDQSTTSLKVFSNEQGFTDVQQVLDLIAKCSAEEQHLAIQFTELCDGIEEVRAKIDQMAETDGIDVEDLNREIGEMSRHLIELDLMIITDDWKTNAVEALVAYNVAHSTLADCLNNLEPDPELKYIPEAHKVRADRIQVLLSIQPTLKKQSLELSEKISIMEHRRDEGHTECPECKHSWFKGFDEQLYKALLKDHETVTAKITEWTEEYEKLCEIQTKSSEIMGIVSQINLTARVTTVLDAMWMGLHRDRFMRLRPQEALEYVRATGSQIKLSKERLDVIEQLDSLKKTREKVLAAVNDGRQDLMTKATGMEAKLVELQERRAVSTSHLRRLNEIRKAMENQAQYVTEFEDLMTRRTDLISKAEIANHHEIVNAIIIQMDADILSRERQIAQIDQQKAVIKSLEDEVTLLTRKEGLLRKAMDSLSPTKGLIARGLTGFINHFIAQMNAVVKKVWLYPLELSPIKVTEDDKLKLDYNFPVIVDGNAGGKDVKESSGAQVEIFDMAFMLASAVNMGMDTMEAFLDEFSIKMDYAHRKEAMKMITDLLLTSNFSQIFMISHYESSYGALSDADITILCPENIQVPTHILANSKSIVKR